MITSQPQDQFQREHNRRMADLDFEKQIMDASIGKFDSPGEMWAIFCEQRCHLFCFFGFFGGGGVFMTLKLYINNDLSSRMRNGHDGYLLIKSKKIIAIRINREKALDTKELL